MMESESLGQTRLRNLALRPQAPDASRSPSHSPFLPCAPSPSRPSLFQLRNRYLSRPSLSAPSPARSPTRRAQTRHWPTTLARHVPHVPIWQRGLVRGGSRQTQTVQCTQCLPSMIWDHECAECTARRSRNCQRTAASDGRRPRPSASASESEPRLTSWP